MIVDLILDRKDGKRYNPREFYYDCLRYESTLEWHEITKAMDYGTEEDTKRALCEYILNNKYNPKIMVYIYSVNWLG